MTRAAATAAPLCLALLAGCGNPLMPTPVGFDRQGADPFARTVPQDRDTQVRLFLASNRTVHEGAAPAAYLGNDRAPRLRLGTLDVRIGDDGLGWDRLVDLSRTDGRQGSPPVALASIDDFGCAWTQAIGMVSARTPGTIDESVRGRFTDAVDYELAACGSAELFVFLHGFNTDVPGNAAVAASLFHYLGRNGAFVQFEWPSRNSIWSYQADKAAASASVRTFRGFLQHVASQTKAQRIHLIAHSAGAPIALEALHELRLMQAAAPADAVRRSLRLGRLVLVAPDMDLGDFRDCVADGATELPERTTIYVSSRDKALDFSAWMSGFARLGQPLQALTPRQVEFLEDDANVDIVDVAAAERRMGSWLGHSYFHEDPWVSTDVLLTLATDAHPLDRGLQRDGERKVYAFGDQYPVRAREAARRVLAPAAARSPAAVASPAPEAPAP